MNPGRIVIVSGPPGAGKSTVARGLANGAPGPLAVHMHTDDFYTYIRKGFVPPWMPESQAQNTTVLNALAASAAIYARAGYDVMVDGIVGVWFLDPWRAVRAQGVDVRYVVLMPSETETIARAIARTHAGAMNDAEISGRMWRTFKAHPAPDDNILDTTGENAATTVARVQTGLAADGFQTP